MTLQPDRTCVVRAGQQETGPAWEGRPRGGCPTPWRPRRPQGGEEGRAKLAREALPAFQGAITPPGRRRLRSQSLVFWRGFHAIRTVLQEREGHSGKSNLQALRRPPPAACAGHSGHLEGSGQHPAPPPARWEQRFRAGARIYSKLSSLAKEGFLHA